MGSSTSHHPGTAGQASRIIPLLRAVFRRLCLKSRSILFNGMTARPGRQFLSSCALLLFLFGTSGDALARHLCPHHDADLVQTNGSAESGAHHAHGESAPAKSDEHGCTCVGTCVESSASAAPVLPSVIAELPVREHALAEHRPVQAPRSPIRYLLPPAHAPPVVA
jgi:hypothetical protein